MGLPAGSALLSACRIADAPAAAGAFLPTNEPTKSVSEPLVALVPCVRSLYLLLPFGIKIRHTFLSFLLVLI